MSNKRVNKLGKVFVTLLLLPLAVIVPVLSLESHYAPATQAQTQTDSAQTQRIAAYKAALGREVKAAEQTKIKLRCSVAQANAKTLSSRLSTVQKNRNAAYDSILKSLNDLEAKLNKQAFETTGLQQNIQALQTLVDSYKTNMNNYYLAVNDMATMDCAADPAGFVAALQAARTAHDSLTTQITEIRTYVTNTVKPTLSQIRTQIEDGQTTGGAQ